ASVHGLLELATVVVQDQGSAAVYGERDGGVGLGDREGGRCGERQRQRLAQPCALLVAHPASVAAAPAPAPAPASASAPKAAPPAREPATRPAPRRRPIRAVATLRHVPRVVTPRRVERPSPGEIRPLRADG